MRIFSEAGSKKVNWVPYNGNPGAVTWYKVIKISDHQLRFDVKRIIHTCQTSNIHLSYEYFVTTIFQGYFDAPEGKDPVAIRMMSMEKGMIWINGLSIGRYWVSYLSPLGKPTQEE